MNLPGPSRGHDFECWLLPFLVISAFLTAKPKDRSESIDLAGEVSIGLAAVAVDLLLHSHILTLAWLQVARATASLVAQGNLPLWLLTHETNAGYAGRFYLDKVRWCRHFHSCAAPISASLTAQPLLHL